jgi:hypothetical protein
MIQSIKEYKSELDTRFHNSGEKIEMKVTSESKLN